MSYAQGNLIEASDYNGLNGGSSGASVSGQLNSVWGIGTGDNGYGQTTAANVAIGNTVTATQWATLINNLNNARKHQSGAGYTNLTAPVVGNRVDFISTLSSRLNDAFTNRINFAASGSTVTGTFDVSSWGPFSATQQVSVFRDINVTFASSDQARYFFNAGGSLTLVCGGFDTAGTSRSAAIVSCLTSIGGVNNINYTGNGGRTGTGNTLTYQNTSLGYYDLIFDTPQYMVQVNSSSAPYTSILATAELFAGDSDTTRGSKGRVVCIRVYAFAPADDVFGGGVSFNLSVRCDINYPSTSFLTNSWGTPTITFDSV